MSIVSQVANLSEANVKFSGPTKFRQVRVQPSSAIGTWGTSSTQVSYFLPPNQKMILGRSAIQEQALVAALGNNIRACVNPAVNNRYNTIRLQLGSVEVLNMSNFNNGYSRSVRDACTPMKKFLSNPSLSKDYTVGAVSAASQSSNYGGLQTLLGSVAAAPAVSAILGENQFLPLYARSATAAYDCTNQNVPSDYYLDGAANTARTFTFLDRFSDFYGTILCVNYALPTGSGSILSMTRDSVDKQFSAVTIADAGTYAQLNTAATVTAAATMGSNVTVSQNFLKLTLLSQDAIQNGGELYDSAIGSGVEINIPWISQINQSAGSGTSFANNVTLSTAGQKIRAICSSLVLSSTNLRDTQNNASNGTSVGLLSCRSWVNSNPDTDDVLYNSDATLYSYVHDNALYGTALSDISAYQAHPVYVSNFTGMSLAELHENENVLCDIGLDMGQMPLVYQVEGTQDAVSRTLQIYVLGSKKLMVHRDYVQLMS